MKKSGNKRKVRNPASVILRSVVCSRVRTESFSGDGDGMEDELARN